MNWRAKELSFKEKKNSFKDNIGNNCPGASNQSVLLNLSNTMVKGGIQELISKRRGGGGGIRGPLSSFTIAEQLIDSVGHKQQQQLLLTSSLEKMKSAQK